MKRAETCSCEKAPFFLHYSTDSYISHNIINNIFSLNPPCPVPMTLFFNMGIFLQSCVSKPKPISFTETSHNR